MEDASLQICRQSRRDRRTSGGFVYCEDEVIRLDAIYKKDAVAESSSGDSSLRPDLAARASLSGGEP
jgi:hypothetical protein